jgi:glyoxylase-like metal-dependent hydrolase (beta-lactamase superfamily II)
MGRERGNSQPGPALPGPPADGDYVELQGGILWVRLPIPGGLKHINAWLLPDEGGWHLVDTGMDTADVRRAWTSLEQRLPLRRALRDIVVTHHHPDHFGLARWLAGRHDVPVRMTRPAHAAATASLAKEGMGVPSRSEEFAWRFGLDLGDDTRRILRGNTYRSIVSGMVDAATIEAGMAIGRGAGGWTVSIHDGHAPGHACLYDSAAGILVSGDQLLPAISSNISLYPSNEQEDPLGQYLESLQVLCLLPTDTLVLPSHGRPFSSLHARAAALREEHEGRLRRIHAVTAQPAGTMQVAAGIFRLERLDALNRLLATTETLAHLRWLELRGMVTRSGEGSGMRWSATGANTDLLALQKQ